MKVMVIGGGGREHAIIKKLRESSEITELYVLRATAALGATRSASISVQRI